MRCTPSYRPRSRRQPKMLRLCFRNFAFYAVMQGRFETGTPVPAVPCHDVVR